MPLGVGKLFNRDKARQASSSRVASWVSMIYDIFQTSENDMVKAGHSFVYDSIAVPNENMLSEWAKRMNGTLMVGSSCAYFKDLLSQKSDIKNIATGTVRNSIGYVQYLNLPQLLTISNFTRTETSRASSAVLQDFGVQVAESVFEQLLMWMLKNNSYDGDDAGMTQLSQAEKRFIGRKAFMNIAALHFVMTNSKAAQAKLRENSDGVWVYIFGGSAIPEDGATSKGFFFHYPSLRGTGTRPADAQVFTLAQTANSSKNSTVPWHFLCLEPNEELLGLINAVLNFKGNAAPKVMTKAYQPKYLTSGDSTVADKNFVASPSTVASADYPAEKTTDDDVPAYEDTTTADADATESGQAETEAAEAEYGTAQGEYDEYAGEYAEGEAAGEGEEAYEAEGEEEAGDEWGQDWDETALAAWDAGIVLFYDNIKESYIYYARQVWYDADQNWYYYWDNETGAYNYLDDESNQAILDNTVPCLPEGYGAENEEDMEGGEGDGEGEEDEGAYEEGETAEASPEETPAPSVPSIQVTATGSPVAVPEGAPANLQAKAAPKPKLSMRLSFMEDTKIAGSVECFKASDATILSEAVKYMDAIFGESEEEYQQWERRPNGTLKVGKCKRLFDQVMTKKMELKSISATDITNMASVLNHLNIQQLLRIRVASSNSTWERCPLEHLKRFAMKCDNLIGEYFSDLLVMKTLHEQETDLREQHKLLPANERRFLGLQELLVLGGLTQLKKSQLFYWSDTSDKEIWWFCPAHPVGGATVPKGDVTGRPTGCFLQTPTLRVQFNRPRGVAVYRLVAGKQTPGFMNWDVLECKTA